VIPSKPVSRSASVSWASTARNEVVGVMAVLVAGILVRGPQRRETGEPARQPSRLA
jgi:hypothetical protein